MSREAELIKEINEHIKKAGGLYGLELSDGDLRIIQAALVEKEIQMSRIEPGDVVRVFCGRRRNRKGAGN